jgi:MoxR-like ATPase
VAKPRLSAARVVASANSRKRRKLPAIQTGRTEVRVYASPTPRDMTINETQAQLEAIQASLDALVREVQQVIVGQDEVLRSILTCLLAGGHGLLEGVPGLGKTLMIRELNFQPGPVFANIVLADEINRATPKTQSALLEAMAESQVTAAGKTRELPQPFLVLATQNPLEMEGTYPLPEAQLDRFLFKIDVPFPGEQELLQILERTTGNRKHTAKPVIDGRELMVIRQFVRAIPVAPTISRYVVRVLRATHPDDANATDLVKRYVRFGGSPRGAQAILLAARIRSLMAGRKTPSIDDVRAVTPSALRHRVILNFEGEAEGVAVDKVLAQVLAGVATD